ncbi:MAG: ABC transporter permease [Acidiferrobacteraceae bacterium]
MNWLRLRGLVRKEILQIRRDPSAIAIALVLPFVLLLLVGYGVSLDVRHVPLALVTGRPSAQTEALFGGFYQSPYFSPRTYRSMALARSALTRHQVDGIVWLRGDFSRGVLAHRSPTVGVFVNGVDANSALLIEGYIQGVWRTWVAQEAHTHGTTAAMPVSVDDRVWFNPARRSSNYLIPGLVAIIMTLIGALLTALVVAREWERGTMEALMATPVTMSEILLSKLIPYFALGMGGMAVSVAMAVWLFEVPLRGSLFVVLTAAAVFLLAALGMGLLISTVARNQFVASMIAIVSTFLPAFMLSGFIFDVHSMPVPIRLLTHAIAARYFVAILQTVFAAGDVWPVVLANGAALLVMAALFLGLTWRLSHKRLD